MVSLIRRTMRCVDRLLPPILAAASAPARVLPDGFRYRPRAGRVGGLGPAHRGLGCLVRSWDVSRMLPHCHDATHAVSAPLGSTLTNPSREREGRCACVFAES